MANNNKTKAESIYDALGGVAALTGDTLKSVMTGQGSKGDDKAASLHFCDNHISRSELAAAFANNWIARKIVMIPVQDATRKGRIWQGDQAEQMAEAEREFDVRSLVFNALWQSRLLGGSAIYMSVKNHDDEEPLEIDSIGKGDLEHLVLLNRNELEASQINMDIKSGNFRRPDYYTITGVAEQNQVKIHPSRLIIFKGAPRLTDELYGTAANQDTARYYHNGEDNEAWGESVLKAVYDTILHSGSVFSGVAHLVLEANIDVVGIKGLMKCVDNADWRSALMTRLRLAKMGKGLHGMLVLDREEEFSRRAASFSNLHNIMEAFQLACAAAADIPGTRFLGRTPAGLASTGESDLANYYDHVASIQTVSIDPVIRRLDQAIMRSTFGDIPEGLKAEWLPLRQQTEMEQAETADKRADAIKKLGESSVVPLESIYAKMKGWNMLDGTEIGDFQQYVIAIGERDEDSEEMA